MREILDLNDYVSPSDLEKAKAKSLSTKTNAAAIGIYASFFIVGVVVLVDLCPVISVTDSIAENAWNALLILIGACAGHIAANSP